MILLVSHPESGNTWLRVLCALARHGDGTSVEDVLARLLDYSPGKRRAAGSSRCSTSP